MEVIKKNMNSILPDNEETYLGLLIGVIESVDEFSHLEITRLFNGYKFRISTSIPLYNNSLIQEIINLNNRFGIYLSMGKSIKSSSTISFFIRM